MNHPASMYLHAMVTLKEKLLGTMLFHSWSHLILTAALWHDDYYPTLQMRRLRLWEVKWLRWGHRVQESWKSKTVMVPVNHTIWVGGYLTVYSFPSSLSFFKLKGSGARCLLIKNEIVCYNLLQNVCLITTLSPTKSLNWIQIACLMLYIIFCKLALFRECIDWGGKQMFWKMFPD